MEAERRGFLQGVAYAAAELYRRDQPTLAAELLSASGLTTYAALARAGVDEHDSKACRKVITAERLNASRREIKKRVRERMRLAGPVDDKGGSVG